MKFFEWLNKRREWSVFGIFVIEIIVLALLPLLFVETKCYWKEVSTILQNYPTIILALGSLPIAFVLWLFRNHDIVMGLDLTRHHKATEHIHSKDAPVGLRQMALATLLELRKKWIWEKEITAEVFAEANLDTLDLQGVDLQGIFLQWAKINGALLSNSNLKETVLADAELKNTKLKRANLEGADLEGAILENADLRSANLRKTVLKGANLTKAILWKANLTEAILQGANLTKAILERANLQKTNLQLANLTEANLHKANLQNTELGCAYYYKNKEDEKNDNKTDVTEKWLREKGALNVETAKIWTL